MTKLNKILSLITLALITVSCSKEKESNFTLKGHIKGLKKGVVYLQKNGDSTDIIDLDSMQIKGEPNFSLHTNIDEPILMYLKLFKNDGAEHYIPFFADKGVTEINTSLKTFNYDAKIKGSKQQDLLNEYKEMITKFNNQNLDLLEANYLAQRDNDTIALDSIIRRTNSLIKRKYAFIIQFAMNNKNSEIAPYIALYEMPNANPKYIDSVYYSLNDTIKNSYYGKKLNEVISNRNPVE
ncbi:DUF4369 domain-containing protein [Winogradskyella echinorum]|uniref:DUF4369 domain-containing protein n=1 Tax=Winogradskyella echinorum TaxID=538189 RepID=A0ABR6Y2U9_9FLAO|nr:DUF4369 domain-containing protein [Winogradskyella echinorum]MBC3847071.1 DUF4369 domain-containing protein [Winogradskyella echinorum]MBC5751419.1 DUF4369 domain-containing protein [Winogradskyella echinorum]